MKRCSKCGQPKSLDEFYKDKRTKDGLYSHCKDCHSLYYHDNRDEKNAKGKAYYRKNRRKIIDRQRAYYQRHKDEKREYDQRYRKSQRGKEVHHRALKKWLSTGDGPQKRQAAIALNNAVKLGKIAPISTQSCIVCNEQAEHYHHHKGYDEENWLDVVPMCYQHHRDVHNQT